MFTFDAEDDAQAPPWGSVAQGGKAAGQASGGPDPVSAGALCARCTSPIPSSRQSAGTPAKYCSHECRHAASAERKAGVGIRERLSSLGRRVDCEACGAPIEDERLRGQGGRTRYCGGCGFTADKRRRAEANRRYQGKPRERLLLAPVAVEEPAPNVVASTLGALNELAVAADLMRRGYDVFRALSPASPCDLLALRGGLTVRIEVRSVTRGPDGKLRKVVHAKDRGRFDVAALVERNGAIHYKGLPDEAQ